MTQIIDRRLNAKNKSTVNRQRFIRRFKQQIKNAINKINRSIKDIDKGEKISIPAKDILEPSFQHGEGGIFEGVYPGNKQYSQGDLIKKPSGQKSGGTGGEASNEGEGLDNFTFELSKKEFLEIFFEDLELPDLVRKQITEIKDFSWKKAGFTSTGTPTNINIIRSLKHALSRRTALSAPYRKRLESLEKEFQECVGKTHAHENDTKIEDLKQQIETLKRKIISFPFIDPIDLRYNLRIKDPKPSTQAVMFCLMDVSGSMDETKKEIAKRFFILLYLFLTRNYEKIDLVFIRHHTSAKEVGEQEFFYSRETGGTVVSSALDLMKEIIRKRYPVSDWNIYAAQASDGDNWNADSPYCQKLLLENIMPYVQYFAYVEIMPRHHQSLWEAYLTVKQQYPNFAMENVEDLSQIYPVFRELFKRQAA